MKSTVKKSLTVSLAVAAAIAFPTAVKAQHGTSSVSVSGEAASSQKIRSEYNSDCFYIPGYGWYCS